MARLQLHNTVTNEIELRSTATGAPVQAGTVGVVVGLLSGNLAQVNFGIWGVHVCQVHHLLILDALPEPPAVGIVLDQFDFMRDLLAVIEHLRANGRDQMIMAPVRMVPLRKKANGSR